MSHSLEQLAWWNSLRHGGMLLDATRLSKLAATVPQSLGSFEQDRLRRRLSNFQDAPDDHRSDFIKYILEVVCGFDASSGHWSRGSEISPSWSRSALTGEQIRPSHLWQGIHDAVLPVFIDKEKRIGLGRGVRVVSQSLQWMRKTNHRLGLITNGEQWRILYAGLSYEAFAEWDIRQWLSEGEVSAELRGLRTLLAPKLWIPTSAGESSPFIEAINDSRKGQAELSEVLGERVRQAAELLIQGHTAAIAPHIANRAFTSQELYRAAVRMIMRMVVVLFAESRDALLPRDNPIYFLSYSLGGLREQLERVHAGRLRTSYAAYPRIVSLCRLVYEGCSHESLLVRAYGGQLFEPGDAASNDGLSRALAVLEQGCYECDVMNDQQVHQILDLLSRTKIKIRQGRQSSWFAAPVDFSSLDSEYIGILYEGLLDFELRQAGAGEPVIFLAVGNQPALPLATLEAMDDKALKNLLEKMKDTSTGADEDGESDSEESDSAGEDEDDVPSESAIDDAPEDDADEDQESPLLDQVDVPQDDRLTARTRAENWAKRAIEAGKLVTKPRGAMTEEKRLKYAADIDRKARQIITKVILPGEWYLVRWGGTRKGSGTFYTRPQLAIPTVHRTLQPLVYEESKSIPAKTMPSSESAGQVHELHGEYAHSGKSKGVSHATARDASPHAHDSGARDSDDFDREPPTTDWVPRPPEQILSLKICDPACGSGTFPLVALRYLTDALYDSLHYHQRIQYYADRTVLDLIVEPLAEADEKSLSMVGEKSPAPIHPLTIQPNPSKLSQRYRTLAGELLPCRPEDNDFEARTKAVLRRYIVERCIYGVDLDPLAVELCRLSLWIETLDPRLPFTFLDHKIKPGNSLIGTWFDQFMHYPAMAWMREGGDKSHTHGVHFEKESWTKAISKKIAGIKNELIDYIDQQLYLNTGEDLHTIQTVHDEAEKALEHIHRIGIHEADVRAVEYHRLRQSQSFREAKFSLDLWCSIWFWPPEHIDQCPTVSAFYDGKLSDDAKQTVSRLVDQLRFFHWQLEFPDVFGSHRDGFDAIVGNPPWDIAKPNSKEFFSALDPLYRSYGKQEAIGKQHDQFAADIETERRWLEYNAIFRAQSNWLKNSGAPYGDAISTDPYGKKSQDLNLGGGGGGGFERSVRRHKKWKENREGMTGYSQNLEDLRGFRHQGGGDINLYKMFLEQAHALLTDNGRMGFIVPSGIYSDHGTGGLRSLFLDRCRWQWLFGFENREKVFDIDSRFKFNPIIIQKGGQTDSIRTAFMRRDLSDWEHAEKYVTDYPRARVLQFSPRSKAILEIQSQRDLEVLEKIYSNSVLLGDDGPNGWGITYSREFDMTNDSKLFPPRDKWEERGYRPDEYSRWLKGNWQPRTPDSPAPPDCKRVEIPEGIILSRDGQSWISEDAIDTDEFEDKKGKNNISAAIVLPLYQGRMIWQFDYSYAIYESIESKRKDWRDPIENRKYVQGQYMMPAIFYDAFDWRVGFRDVQNATNQKTMIATILPQFPCGNKVANLVRKKSINLNLIPYLTSFPVDRTLRRKMSQGTVNWFYAAELPLPSIDSTKQVDLRDLVLNLACNDKIFSSLWIKEIRLAKQKRGWSSQLAMTNHERMRLRCISHAVAAAMFGMDLNELSHTLRECDYPSETLSNKDECSRLDQKGFFRIGKSDSPELRETILTIAAFDNLSELGLSAFLSQNDGEGWQLPETLRLADYGLGHDARAKEHQPVRECFGPRFYDWQLEQDPEESWRECHLHARNLLGPAGYQALLDEINGQGGQSDDLASSTVREQHGTYVTEHPSTEWDPDDFQLSASPTKRKRKGGK